MHKTDAIDIGLIGLDTSHVSAFAGVFNDPFRTHHLPGARVSAAYPGGTDDWPLSADRILGFTNELRDERGVAMLDDAAEAGVPLMSCSALRYADVFAGEVNGLGGAEAVRGVVV